MMRQRTPPRRARSRERDRSQDHARSRERRYDHSPSPRSRRRTRTPPSPALPQSRTISRPPAPPSFSTAPPQPTPQPTPEQLRSLWADRIKHLADSITGRQQMNKLDTDIASTRNLIDSTRFPSLEDDGKKQIEAELTQLETKRELLKKKREDTITHLVKLNGWPSNPLSDAQIAEWEKQQELLKYTKHLQQSAAELDSLLNDIKKSENLVPSSEGPDSPADSMSRPLKRRRLSDSQSQSDSTGFPTIEELQAVHDKITELEGRYSTLQNDMYSHEQEAREELEIRVEQKLEQFAQSLSVEPSMGQDGLNEVKESLDITGKEIEELAKELSELMLQIDAQKKETGVIRDEIKGQQAEFTQMQAKIESYITFREKDHKTITALEAALQVHISSPPISMPQVTHDELVELMEEPLSDIVRAKIQPLVEELRADVQAMLHAQNQEMCKTLVDKSSVRKRLNQTLPQQVECDEDPQT